MPSFGKWLLAAILCASATAGWTWARCRSVPLPTSLESAWASPWREVAGGVAVTLALGAGCWVARADRRAARRHTAHLAALYDYLRQSPRAALAPLRRLETPPAPAPLQASDAFHPLSSAETIIDVSTPPADATLAGPAPAEWARASASDLLITDVEADTLVTTSEKLQQHGQAPTA